MKEKIEYTSRSGYRGVLYDWHDDPFCGEHYQMSIYSPSGREVCHSYNAAPKTYEMLKKVVDAEGRL